MIIGKRHLVLAGLLIALGAAVYLNWQFAPTEAISDMENREHSSYTEDGYVSVSQNTVSGGSVPASTSASDAVETSTAADIFAQTREDRQMTRQEALDTLSEILDDASVSDEQKETACSTAARIAENMDKEASVELLIKAKGYRDCVVVISDSQVNVVIPVSAEGMKASDAAIIRDIVVGQLNISPGSIKIIEAK